MKIERARKKDFSELMDLMYRSFAMDRPAGFDRFEELFPDLYHASSSAMQNIFIIRAEGHIVSAAGLFPIALAIGPVRLTVAGIGGVCTAPEHRGKGGMSALMTEIMREARAAGYPLAWLSGRRARYRRFGFERAGSALAVRMETKPPQPRALTWQFQQAAADPQTVDMLIGLRATLRVRGLCDDDTFRLKLSRKHVEIWIASLGTARAYMIVNRKKRWCLEWGGDVEGVRALVLHLCSEGQPWLVRLSPLHDEYTDVFLEQCEQYEGTQDCVAVLNTGWLLKEYRSILREIWPPDKALYLRVTDAPSLSISMAAGRVVRKAGANAVAVSVSASDLPRLLFGPVAPDLTAAVPADAAWVRQVFPLPFTVPGLWRV